MGEAIKKSGVPGWAWGIIFTSFVTLMSFTVGAAAGNQKIKDDIQYNSYQINKNDINANSELDKKASMEMVDRNYEALIRIEDKLDEYIANTIK